MKRTQIYLDDEIVQYLEHESNIEQKSISEIIRESVRAKIESRKKDLIAKMNNIFNKWKDKKINPEIYLRKLRKNRTL